MIAFDLVAVSPMSAISGNIAYMEYLKGTDKGESKNGNYVNGVYKLGDVDVNYTGNTVVEQLKNGDKVSFLPATIVKVNGQAPDPSVSVAEDGTISGIGDSTVRVAYVYDNVSVPQDSLPTLKAKLTNIPLEAKPRRIAIYYKDVKAVA